MDRQALGRDVGDAGSRGMVLIIKQLDLVTDLHPKNRPQVMRLGGRQFEVAYLERGHVNAAKHGWIIPGQDRTATRAAGEP